MRSTAFSPSQFTPLSTRTTPALNNAKPRVDNPRPTPNPRLKMSQRLSSVDEIDWLPNPINVKGKVQTGFGRGSRDLGCPTANLPGGLLQSVSGAGRDGVYFGYGVVPKFGNRVVKMVANLGWNITFDDVKERVLEAHLMENFDEDFYGEEMRLCIIAYLRPEWKLNSLDELIFHINNDISVAKAGLDLPQAAKFRDHPFLTC